MNTTEENRFRPLYEQMQQCLVLQGLRPKTVEAYSRAIRRLGEHFDCCPDELTTDQLKDYFEALVRSHTRSLDFHPHVHFIVPAGALANRIWRSKKGDYLFNQNNLAKVFRAKWLQAMRRNGLTVRATLPDDWVVDCRSVGSGDKAPTYLGKYLCRGVVQEKNIISCVDNRLGFTTGCWRSCAGNPAFSPLLRRPEPDNPEPRLILPLDHPLVTTSRAAYSLPFASICFQ